MITLTDCSHPYTSSEIKVNKSPVSRRAFLITSLILNLLSAPIITIQGCEAVEGSGLLPYKGILYRSVKIAILLIICNIKNN